MTLPVPRLLLGVALLGTTLASTGSDPSQPSVRAASGDIRGAWIPAGRGVAGFAAYLGIPYATPPVGPLRFKAPTPPAPLSSPFDATTDPPPCAQISDSQILGQEDCLYLNVYVPEAQQLALQSGSSGGLAALPVLVVIHGGGYQFGCGSLAFVGPHFIVTNDVLVVTINYRVGPFGFTSLDTEEVPGNAGLKDMLLGLQWVKNNVDAFGGDPTRVTVLGWSTGASAVHLLSILPAAQVVLLSGNAISARAYTERHVTRARTLATLLGAKDNRTSTITRVLRDAGMQDILRAVDDARMRVVGLPLPTPERRDPVQGGQPRLVTQDPESLLMNPAPFTRPMHVVMGVVGREGLFAYKQWGLDQRTPAELEELLPRLMPADLEPGRDTAKLLGAQYRGGPGPLHKDASLRLAQLVRDEYAQGGAIASNLDTLIQFVGDTFLYESNLRAARYIANRTTESAPLHLYRFQVDDKYGYSRVNYNITLPGVAHADDLGYYFLYVDKPNLNQSLLDEGVAPQVLRRNTETLASIVKGEPLTHWPAVRRGLEPSSWPVMVAGPGLPRGVAHSALEPHSAFWSSVYRDFRSRHPSIARGGDSSGGEWIRVPSAA